MNRSLFGLLRILVDDWDIKDCSLRIVKIELGFTL